MAAALALCPVEPEGVENGAAEGTWEPEPSDFGAGKLVLIWHGVIGGTVRCKPIIPTSEHRSFGVS